MNVHCLVRLCCPISAVFVYTRLRKVVKNILAPIKIDDGRCHLQC